MAAPPSEDDDDWRFSVEEVGPGSESEPQEPEPREDPDDEADTGGNVAGTLNRNQPLEPGEINLENAAFVVLGALIVVVLIVAAIVGF